MIKLVIGLLGLQREIATGIPLKKGGKKTDQLQIGQYILGDGKDLAKMFTNNTNDQLEIYGLINGSQQSA